MMRLPTLEQKLAFLRRGSSYTERPRRLIVIETHFAWVFLGSRHVYKLKKPLRHGTMDYRTLAQRRRGCHAELMLNRRAAPRVYLGVTKLTMGRSGRMRVGGTGRVIDYLVHMRRLPARWMLDGVSPRRALTDREITALLELLGKFFAGARRKPLAPPAYARKLRRTISENRRLLLASAAALRTQIEQVEALQCRCLQLLRDELATRAHQLLDGHGDLRPEHVCLRPLASIDCIEFDAQLRRMDPLEEVAFLALEMARLGRADTASALMRRYRSTRDPLASDALVHFYMSLRAGTRAKLSAWHIGDPQFADPRPWLTRTRSYLRDAMRHARAALRLLAKQSPSPGRGPALQQRRQRLTRRDPPHR